MAKPAPRNPGGILALLRRLIADRSGVGAVEFAIIAPILLVLYIGAVEITIGLSASKRATRSVATIADLVTQQSSVNKALLATMPNVAESIFAPYNADKINLKISGISIDSAGVAKIVWSWQRDGTRPYVVNSVATIPSDLRKPSTFVVHAEISVPHQLMMFMATTLSYQMNSITIKRDFYYRQRVGTAVDCLDC